MVIKLEKRENRCISCIAVHFLSLVIALLFSYNESYGMYLTPWGGTLVTHSIC